MLREDLRMRVRDFMTMTKRVELGGKEDRDDVVCRVQEGDNEGRIRRRDAVVEGHGSEDALGRTPVLYCKFRVK